MGTRNLTMVISNGKTKVAQYGQWDGYPSGQGETILNFFKKASIKDFKYKVDTHAKWITQNKIEQLYKDAGHDGKSEWIGMDISNKFKAANPQLDRDMAAEVLEYLYNATKTVLLKDDSEFINDGLFCEWAYVIDLDKKTLTVKGDKEKTYSLDKLPTVKKMEKDCCSNE